jgi:peptidoglycan/xylan/chitin deacetylase (PgdA/CDA1 family)
VQGRWNNQAVLGLGHDRILMYHGTPAAHAAALERQLRLVRLAFPVVPLEDIAVGRNKNGRARVALTFDDGLRNNVDVAYPILRKLGLSATFFVCPGLIDRGCWLWNHEARARLNTLSAAALAELAASVGGPTEVETFIGWMKTLKIAARRRVEEAIRAATPGFKPSREQREQFDLASWQELARLDPRVVTLGSHTMSHPILTSLSAEETEAETRDSRQTLEQRLERAVTIFCYPNGDLNESALASARRYYRSAVTVARGTINGNADPHLLPRYSANAQRSRRLVRRMVFG